MKKCPYCSTEYADDAVRCPIEGELPSNPALAQTSAPPFIVPGTMAPQPRPVDLTNRQIQIIEVVLVCLVAFGSAIFSSAHSFYYGASGASGASGRSAFAWMLQAFREVSALGLLWYVLTRQKKSFADLALAWKPSDFGISIVLYIAGSLASQAVYSCLYYSGFTSTNREVASAHVGDILFGAGVPLAALLFQFLNPFFEELIVRAYLMTQVRLLTGSVAKAVVASTLLQTSYHLYQGVPSALGLGAIFLIFSIYYAKTNRIAPLILAHAYMDIFATLRYMITH
jgi:membrane protease YdiL (CAAX protease family)